VFVIQVFTAGLAWMVVWWILISLIQSLTDSYTMTHNKCDAKFQKNFGTSNLILDIYLRIVSILITPVKVHPRTGYEGPEQEKYRFSLSLISTLDGCGWSTPRPGRFTPGKRPESHCTVGSVGPTAGPDGLNKARPPSGCNPRAVQSETSRYTD